MKNTFGKLGFGLAGAIAAVGLMSAGVQTAQAQLEISVPVVTNDLTQSGVYDWTYTITLDPAGATLVNNSTFDFSMASDSALVKNSSGSYYSSTFLGVGNWSALSFNETGPQLYGSATYTGTGDSLTGTIGTFTIFSTTDQAATVGTTTFGTATSNGTTVIVGETPQTGAGNPDFASLTNEEPASPTNPSFYTVNDYIPSISGSTVFSPLPLPAAFWPGLLTLGGMAVVGGLRLRRRTV